MAAANIVKKNNGDDQDAAMDYTAVPSSAVHLLPQYAMVGATERNLKDEGVTYEKSFDKNLSWPNLQAGGDDIGGL